MSKVIDSRVVEMSFDNSNFEKNVSTSMSTLDKLKAKLLGLDETSVNLDKVGKAANEIDLSKLDTALDNINNRFSTMGVIGTTVMQDLTKSALGLVKTFSSNLWSRTLGQIKTGGKARAQNIAQAKFTLEGMGFNFKEYEDDINHAVSGTAYGFDQAAQAASVFGSSGVKAGEEMKAALRGISGVAAMTGSSYEEIAYIFEKVNGLGKVTNESLQMISGRGLNAAAALGKALGKTESQISEMAGKGQIDFKTFAKAMDDAFGEHATDANKTLEGVTDNIRAQLSRIGQAFYDPLYQNESDLVKFFNAIYDKVKLIQKYTSPFAERMAKYVLKLARIGANAINSFDIERLAPVFENLIDIFDNLTNSVENFYTNVLNPFFREIKKAFYDVFPELDNGKSLLVTITEKLAEFTGKMREASKHVGILGNRVSTVRIVFRGLFTVLKVVINILDILIAAFSKLGSIAGVVIATIATAFGNLGRIVTQLLPQFKMIGTQIVAGIAYGILVGIPTIFKSIVEFVRIVVEKFQSLFIIHSPSQLMAIMVGLPIALGIAAGIVMGIEPIREALHSVFTTILSDIANFKDTGFYKAISGIFEGISSTTIALFDLLASSLFKIAEAIKAMDSTKLFDKIADIQRFLILGGLLIASMNFLKMSTYLSAGLYNITRAIKLYVFGRFSFWSKIPDMFKSLSIAVLAMTAVVYLLGKMPYDVAEDGLVRLGIIISGLVGIMLLAGLITKYIEGFDNLTWVKIGVTFLGISSAITSMALACYVLKDVDIDVILAVVGGIVGTMAGLSWAMSQLGTLGSATNAIGYVIAMSMLINAFGKLTLMIAFIPEELIVKSIAVLAALSLMIIGTVGVLVLASKLNSGTYGIGNLNGVAASILSLAAFFAITTMVMKSIAKMKPEEIEAGLGTLQALMFFTTVMIGVIQVTSSLNGQSAGTLFGAAAAILASSLFFKVIADSVTVLGKLKPSEIDQALYIITKIMLLVIAESLVFIVAAKTIGLALAGLAALVASMAISVYLIGSMKEGVVKGFAALAGILVICGLINGFASRLVPADYNPIYKMFLGLAAIVTACAIFVKLVGSMSWEDMTKGLIGLIGIFIGVGRIISLMNANEFKIGSGNIKATVKIIKRVVKSVIAIVAAVVVVGLILEKFSDNPVDTLWNGISAVGLSMIGLMGLIATLTLFKASDIDKINKLAKPIKAMTGAILMITGSLLIMTLIPDPSAIVTGAFSLALVLGAMAVPIYAAKTLDRNQNVKWQAIIAAIGAVVAIALAITVLSSVIADKSWDVVGLAVLSLVGCLAAVAMALVALKQYNVGLDGAIALMAATVPFLIFAVSVGMILESLGDKDWVALDAIATSMFLCIISVAGSAMILSKAMQGSNWVYVAGAVVALGVLCGELILVANALSILIGYDWRDIQASMSYIIGTIYAMAALMGVLGLIASIGGGAGALAMAAAVAVLAGLAGVVYLLAKAMEVGATAVETYGKALQTYFNTKTMQEAADAADILVTSFTDGMSKLAVSIKENGVLATLAMYALSRDLITAASKPLGVASPSTVFFDIAMWVIRGFIDGLTKFGLNPNTGVSAIGTSIFQGFIDTVKNVLRTHSDSKEFIQIAYDCLHGFWSSLTENMTSLAFNPAYSMGLSVIDGLKSGLSDLFSGKLSSEFGAAFGGLFGGSSGGFSEIIKGYGDFSNFKPEDFLNYLSLNNTGISSMSSDGLDSIVESLKAAGYEGENLTELLKEMGVSLEDMKSLGIDVSKLIGTDAAKEGATAVSTVSSEVQNVVDKIIKGDFANAPKRWDKLFEYFINQGKTAQEAYQAMADAQNAVNTKLGSKKQRSAADMEKLVSSAVKKSTEAKAKANEEQAKQNKLEEEQKKNATKNYNEMTEWERKKRENAQKRLTEEQKALTAQHKQAMAANNVTKATKETTEAAKEQYTWYEKAGGAIATWWNGLWDTKQTTDEIAKSQETVSKNAVSQNEVAKEQVKATDTLEEAYKKTANSSKKATDSQIKSTDTLNEAFTKSAAAQEEQRAIIEKTDEAQQTVSQNVVETHAKTVESMKTEHQSFFDYLLEEARKSVDELEAEADRVSKEVGGRLKHQLGIKDTESPDAEARKQAAKMLYNERAEAWEKEAAAHKSATDKIVENYSKVNKSAKTANEESVDLAEAQRVFTEKLNEAVNTREKYVSKTMEKHKAATKKMLQESVSDTDISVNPNLKLSPMSNDVPKGLHPITQETKSKIDKYMEDNPIKTGIDLYPELKYIKLLDENDFEITDFGKFFLTVTRKNFSDDPGFVLPFHLEPKLVDSSRTREQVERELEKNGITKEQYSTKGNSNLIYIPDLDLETQRMLVNAEATADRRGKSAALEQQKKILINVDLDPEYKFTSKDKKSMQDAYNRAYNSYMNEIFYTELMTYGKDWTGRFYNEGYLSRFKQKFEVTPEWEIADAYYRSQQKASFEKFGKDAGETISNAVKSNVEKNSSQIQKDIEDSISKSVSNGGNKIGTTVGNTISTSISKNVPSMSATGDKIANEVSNQISTKTSEKAPEVGTKITKSIGTGMKTAVDKEGPAVSSYVSEKLESTLSTNLSEIEGVGEVAGENVSKGFVKGLHGKDIPDSKFRAPADRAHSQLNSKETKANSYKTGENNTIAFANGMVSPNSKRSVEKSAITIADLSKFTMMRELDQHSPSKVFYEIGSYTIAGFVNGILSMVGQVANASTVIGEASINSIVPVVGGIQNAVQEGLDMTPVITPVINASNVQNEIDSINDLLGQRHIASITENFKATEEYKLQETQGMEARMNDMQGAIDNLSTAMLNMPQPVVDTHVHLEGDADGVFKLVRGQNSIYTNMHGRSAFV